MTWLPDGRLVFTSTASGLPQSWIVDSDGQNMREITSRDRRQSTDPSASPDGKRIYFHSFAPEGFCLFRVAPDGSGLQQLTRDGDARNPVVSPDGATVYFMAMKSGSPKLMKVASDGGLAAQVTDHYFRLLAISPNGKELLGVGWSGESAGRAMLATMALADGTITLLPEFAALSSLYMPDGSLVVIQRREGKNMLVSRPIRGGTPRVLAEAGTDAIFAGAVGAMAGSRSRAAARQATS